MTPAKEGLAVCITGMHRSGTSMVANVLSECGVYLGEANELLPAGEGNVAGHFEHQEFVQLNDEVLAALGGAWDVVPPRYTVWRRRRLGPLRERAAALVNRMRPHTPWGWKDPRTSLTLPFWLDVVPDLRLVVCVRDVVAVAHSLLVRDHSSELFGMRLWTAYNRRVLRASPRGRTLVARYESYFDDPRRETERLVAFLGLPADPETVGRAAATVDRSLRHHQVDYNPAGLPRGVARCRRELARRAARAAV
jgi:hypothetical protein